MKRSSLPASGFTLIETLVSLGVFSIVITIVVGSLLMLVGGNQRVQGEQAVMSNLTFALDSMTREIRTGTHYYCGASNASTLFNTQESYGTTTQDCAGGNSSTSTYQGISFRESGNSITGSSARIAYFYDGSTKTIRRRIGNGTSESIISGDMQVTRAEFFVTGSETLSKVGPGGDTYQPVVTITIEAAESADATAKPFIIQTTITQRALDL